MNAQRNAIVLPQPTAVALLGNVMGSFEEYLNSNGQDCYCDNPQCVRVMDEQGHVIPGASRRIPMDGKIYMSCVPCPGARTDHRGHFECGDCRAKCAMMLASNGRVECRACVAAGVDPLTGRQSRSRAVNSEWLQRKVRDHKREAFNNRTYEQSAALADYCRQIDEAADAAGQADAMAGGVDARAEALEAAHDSNGRIPGESLESWVKRRRELDDEIDAAQRALQDAQIAACAASPDNDDDDDDDALPPVPPSAEAAAEMERRNKITQDRLMAASVALAAKQQEQQEVTGMLTRARTEALRAQAEHEAQAAAEEARADLAAPEPTAEELEQQRIKEQAKEKKRQRDRDRRAAAKAALDARLSEQKRKADESDSLRRKLARTEQKRAESAGRVHLLEHKLAVQDVEIRRSEAAMDALEPFLRAQFATLTSVDAFMAKWNMEVAKSHAAIADAPELEAEPAANDDPAESSESEDDNESEVDSE